MKRKFLNTDPLNKNVFLGGSSYKTGNYPQAIYLPDENEPMIFLKELEHSQLYIGLTALKVWAINQ
jgi:hypothetical protein